MFAKSELQCHILIFTWCMWLQQPSHIVIRSRPIGPNQPTRAFGTLTSYSCKLIHWQVLIEKYWNVWKGNLLQRSSPDCVWRQEVNVKTDGTEETTVFYFYPNHRSCRHDQYIHDHHFLYPSILNLSKKIKSVISTISSVLPPLREAINRGLTPELAVGKGWDMLMCQI